MVPSRVAGEENGGGGDLNLSDSRVHAVNNGDHLRGGAHGDAERAVEAGALADPIRETARAAACDRRDDALGRDCSDPVRVVLGHDDDTRGGNDGDAARFAEFRVRAFRVVVTAGAARIAASRKRRDCAGGRDEPHEVVLAVGNNDRAVRRADGDARRAGELSRSARAIQGTLSAAPGESLDNGAGVRAVPDEVVARVGHDDGVQAAVKAALQPRDCRGNDGDAVDNQWIRVVGVKRS